MFKEITESELAEMFVIPLEQFRKECDAGIITCIAEVDEKIIDAFNNIAHENVVTPNVLREILEKAKEVK